MYYCEKCKTANAEKVCAHCGNPNLRIAKDDGFSVFCKMSDDHFATMFIEALKSNDIDVVAIPCGFSLTTRANDSLMLYIPVKHLDAAYDIYVSMFGE